MPPHANGTARSPQAIGLRLLVGLTVTLAVVGAAVAGLLLARGAPVERVIGQPVQTSFGAFTVTNVTTTFVPDTQGPPSQHNAKNGNMQLQVWVRLVNERADQGVAYAPTQLRLVTGAGSGKGQDPDGSSLKPAQLPRGGSIDGRVWFDLPKGEPATLTGRWLEFKDPGGDAVRVALDPPHAGPGLAAPSLPSGADLHATHDGADLHAAPASAGVVISGFAFSGTLTVKPGQKVTVTNRDSTPHTLTDQKAHLFDTGDTAGSGGTGSFTAPTKPGSYPFGCVNHQNMRGTLIVQD